MPSGSFKTHMGSRRKARECALQLLYRLDVGGGRADDIPDLYWKESDVDTDARVYAEHLYRGVLEHRDELDALIATHSAHWKMSRMAAVDKNILRIAVFELKHDTTVPVRVTLNEAVEIAKCFGSAESGAFVNGILDALAKALRPGES